MWTGPQVTGMPPSPAHVDGTAGHRCATSPCGWDPRSQVCHQPMWMGPQATGVPPSPAHVDGTPGHRCASSWAMTGADSVLQAGEEPLLIPCYFDVS